MEKLTWTKLKILLDSVNPPLYSFKEDAQFINIFIVLSGVLLDCDIDKSTADYTTFETSYRARLNLKTWDASGMAISSSAPFRDAVGFRFRGASFSASVPASTTQDIDYKITETRHINGGRLLVNTPGIDDTFTFQVVDKDNVLGYGSGVVLDEFISSYFVPSNGDCQVQLDYPARIITNLYIRLKYTNTSASAVTVKCNLYLHKKT